MRQRYYNPVSYVDPFGLSPILEQEAGNNTLHKILAIAGFLPVVGGVADALDAMLYLAEGDKEGAFTAIMAMACGGVASVVIARSVSTITRAAKTFSNVAKLPPSASLVRKAANTFSNSGSFMKVASNGADIAHTVKAAKQHRTVDKLKDGINSVKKKIKSSKLDGGALGKSSGKAYQSGSTTRAYQSTGRMNDDLLLNPRTNTNGTINLTEWRRQVRKVDIKAERIKFVGEDAVKVDKGVWRSLDGTRQFRVVETDYFGGHPIGDPKVYNVPHVHFEFLSMPNPGGNKLKVIKNIHVPLIE